MALGSLVCVIRGRQTNKNPNAITSSRAPISRVGCAMNMGVRRRLGLGQVMAAAVVDVVDEDMVETGTIAFLQRPEV